MLTRLATSIATSTLTRKTTARQMLVVACLAALVAGCDDAALDDETLLDDETTDFVFDGDDEFRAYWRRPIIMIDCNIGNACLGMWQWSTSWSYVYPRSAIEALPSTSPSTVWTCDSSPDVDTCRVVDSQGRIGCYRWVYNDVWAVAVVPQCVFSVPGWIDVGNDMQSKVSMYYNPY